ncbi:MAG: hypothetical protein ACFFBC_00535 [Promethearchaeota archaeon]
MLLVLNIHSALLLVDAKQGEDEYATFSWTQTTYSATYSKIWDGESVIQNYTGSYSDVFTFTDHYVNLTDNTYIEETRIVDYDANYSYYYNYTREGSFDLDIDINVYRVDVDYGSAKLIWMALKKGFYELDTYRETYGYNYGYNETNHQIIDKEIKKYDRDTLELLETINETVEVYDTMNYTGGDPVEIKKDRYIINETFTRPLILVFQIYETEKGDHIAWASTFSEFLPFNDEDRDGVYSVGDFTNPPSGSLDMLSSSEGGGWFTPQATETGIKMVSLWNNETSVGNFPADKTVDEIASLIKFTPPSLSGNDTVVWGINYRDFPIDAFIGNPDIPFEQWIGTKRDPFYDEVSPGDFSYGFQYKIGSGKADLSLTLGIPSFSELDTYNILERENFGLAIPRYDYFVSSFNIDEVNPIEVTMPSDRFIFESNSEPVAEIDLVNPIKKNYTLHDYPKEGEITSIESRGASINKIIMHSPGLVWSVPEASFLFTLEDLVGVIRPGFIIADSLYHIHTENYPTWAGKKLVHDPTNTIYFENITLPFRVAASEAISGFDITLIFGALTLAVLVITLEYKKFKKKF